MIIQNKYSPNTLKKIRKSSEIKTIVIHYTGMQSKIESIKRLLNPRFKVSCHYLIDRKGKILRMVEDKKISWHAGKSKWGNFVNLNKNSIGIELVNKGHDHGYEKFTNSQIKHLIKLCLILKKKYKIKNSNIVGHSDIAPFRKSDPGEKFPWKKLSNKGVGIWYKKLNIKNKKLSEKKMNKSFFNNLFKIGYRYFNLRKSRKNDHFVVKSFQRRFNQKNITGQIDKKTYIISQYLAKSFKN